MKSQTKMKLLRLLIIITGLFFFSNSADAIWYDSNYLYKKEISINYSLIDSDLANFPIYVNASTNVDATKVRADYYDVIFVDGDDITALDFEREATSTFWVEVLTASSSATSTFYMYYGNASAGDISSSTAPWDSNFKGVWHKTDDPSTDSTTDSTTLHDGTSVGSWASSDLVAGKINKAYEYDGNDEYIDVGEGGGDFDNMAEITVEWWMKTPDAGATYPSVVDKLKDASNSWGNYLYNNGGLYLIVCDLSMTNFDEWKVTDNVQDDAWHYVTFTYADANDLIGYIDGTTSGSLTKDTFTGNLVDSSGKVLLGHTENPYLTTYTGLLDEVRISNTERSAAWVKASYNSGLDTLLEYGAEEEAPAEETAAPARRRGQIIKPIR